MFHHCVVQGLL
jgi:hypothetical protein